jgi:hypothetical protein
VHICHLTVLIYDQRKRNSSEVKRPHKVWIRIDKVREIPTLRFGVATHKAFRAGFINRYRYIAEICFLLPCRQWYRIPCIWTSWSADR